MSDSLVLTDRDGPVVTWTINRPKVLNALTPEVLEELAKAVEAVQADDDVRCVILTGAGPKSFVAGADIAAMRQFSVEDARRFAHRGHAILHSMETMRVPVIAAVNGFALGGGCELALACDFIHASDKARFGQPEVKLGVIPGFGGTQRLARRVGIAMARELNYAGAMIPAARAKEIGLANDVHAPDALLENVKALATTIAGMGPRAVAEAKRVMGEGEEQPLMDANHLEAEAFAELFGTEDQKEGMDAFLGKRDPSFQNR